MQIDADDIEIDIDAIDASTFWVVDKYVKDCSQPGGSSAKALNKKRPRDDPAAVAAPSMASGKK
jgi:Bromodomain extra-terminal - transcription regulation